MNEKIRKILFIILFIFLFILIYQSESYATSVSKTGITSVGASTINIEDVDWYNPSSKSTTGSLSYKRNSNYTKSLVYWNTESLASGKTLKGTYTLFYENVGFDSKGDSIDLTIYSSVVTENIYTSTITWDNDTAYLSVMYLPSSSSYPTAMSGSRYTSNFSDASGDGVISHTTYLSTYQNFTITFTKHGTSTAASGNYLYYLSDIDVVRTNGAYSEAVTLGSAFNSSTVYLESDTYVAVSNSNKTYTGTTTDDSTELSSLTTLVTSPFTFTWYGANCGTKILEHLNISNITSKIYTSTNGSSYSLSTTGGSIAATNTTTSTSNYSVLSQTSSTSATIDTYWKNNYKYTTSANTGYHLAKITYDGTTSTSSSSYTFSSVVSDHTFYAYYMINSYKVVFDGNGSTSGSTSSMTSLYYDTTYTLNENGFERTGYTFTGWNTKADGTGTSYTDKQSFKNLTTTNGGTVTLYAQWEADPCNIYVYYVDYYTDDVLDSNDYTGVYGEDVTTSSKEIDGYTLILSPDTEDYTLSLEDTYVYYYYAKNSDVIVYYLNYYTDEEIADTVTIEGYEGLSYTTEQKDIESYEFVTSTSNTEGTMEDDTIYVYYYYEELVDLEITKINYDNEPLEGAVFYLFKLICTNSSHDHTSDLIDIDDYNTECWELVETYTSDEDGIISIENLYISGIYRLIETKAPGGYLLPVGQLQIEFNYNDNLSQDEIHTLGDLELSITGIGDCPYIDIENDVLYLYNQEAITLPLTGGMGTACFVLIGSVMFLFGLSIIIYNYKKIRVNT